MSTLAGRVAFPTAVAALARPFRYASSFLLLCGPPTWPRRPGGGVRSRMVGFWLWRRRSFLRAERTLFHVPPPHPMHQVKKPAKFVADEAAAQQVDHFDSSRL